MSNVNVKCISIRLSLVTTVLSFVSYQRLNMVIQLESEGRRKTKKDWFYVKSHRSKILNYVIIYKLQLFKYKYNGLKFY